MADEQKTENDIFEPDRPAWDETFMEIVKILAQRPVCIYHRVACVYVNPENHRIIDTGYNGPPPEFSHCNNPNYGCSKDKGDGCIGLHAEDNATLVRPQSEYKGAILYISYLPCTQCMKKQIALKIGKIIFSEKYQRRQRPDEKSDDNKKSDFEIAIGIASKAHIEVRQWDYETKTSRKVI